MSILKTIVVDNGSDRIKWGYSGQPNSLQTIGNYIAKPKGEKRNYIGNVESAKSKFGIYFRRPFDRGYPINWDAEKEIWDEAFGTSVVASETQILLTEPLFNPESVKKVQNEMIFEDYGFQAMHLTSAPVLALFNGKLDENLGNRFAESPCQLIVDSGYSFTHIVPFFDGQKINHGIKRINVGGKTLTNALKEAISFRQWNVMEETYLVNLIKEKLCYVSLNFLEELEGCRVKGPKNKMAVEYVLPDYINHHEGYVLDRNNLPVDEDGKKIDLQVLKMNNERITIPEILFNPSYTGVSQAGIAEAIVQSVESCHNDMHAPLYANILVIGGCSLFPGFKERLYQEVRRLVPEQYEVNIHIPQDPTTYAWQGGCKLSSQPDWKRNVVTKAEYQEKGHLLCSRRFFN